MPITSAQSFLLSLAATCAIAGSTVPVALGQTPTPTTSPAAKPAPTLIERLGKEFEKYQIPTIIAVAAGLGYLGVLWLKPLWLLKVPSASLSLPWTNWKVPLGVVKPLKYRNRVLDAWVECYWKTAKEEFLRLPTVEKRSIHITLPVSLDKEPINELTEGSLRPLFKKKSAVLLITGEGGAGKTSLACQIARWGLEQKLATHRMLPVLVETELDDKQTLLEVIRGQLGNLTHQPEAISVELLEKLLQQQRVLVIVDHLSEMSELTRKQINPKLADFLPKALVVTSRLEETDLLTGVPNATLYPLKIEGGRLSRFMDLYLERCQKRELFEDEEYFEACRNLSRIVGQRNITVLLARLYADQMIEQKAGAGDTLPSSIPELMLSYLNQVNRAIEPANQKPNLHVQRDMQLIAWECLKETYRPTVAKRDSITTALKISETTEPGATKEVEDRLTYLEKRLRLIQTLEPGDKIRVILDPLAEYLAANCLVDSYRHHDNPAICWEEFFTSIDQKLEQANESAEVMQGFLLAVRDCCLLKQKEANIPADVPDRLARKANLDPEALRQAEKKRRIRLLISDLAASELKYRLRAAEDLSAMGAAAIMAEPNLIGMLENPNQDFEARQAAAQALGKLGIGKATLLNLLTNAEAEPTLRRSAAEALGLMKAGKAELLRILESDTEPVPVRQGAARAIGQIGAGNGEPVPMLVAKLEDNQIIAEVRSIPVWREELSGDIGLNLVSIPGGEFLMGSPADEADRDWYKYSLPELEGVDVEAQHLVKVPSFLMSQYPITQVQWRIVAGLPAINRELNPDPANFKGDHRPVELVSWYDAVEFCDRLSQYTGKAYRLPSGAEWEYACRAGTTTPFHFGKTLSTEIANYNGNYTYGTGEKGVYRQATTEVGYFGVVNAFGLSDMHGTVWEWCLDHWHPSYENAPTDGSAWIIGGDSRYRLVRGGSWYLNPGFCRSAVRNRLTPSNRNNLFGFRVVCVSPWTQ